MRLPVLDTRWLPVLLAVVTADLNFWYFASTGENDADYAGIALFALLAAYYLQSFIRRRERFSAVAAVGALAALVIMVLREMGSYDQGYILPYAVFVVFVLVGGARLPRADG